MNVFKSIISTIVRINSPRLPVKTGYQVKLTSAMDVVKADEKETDELISTKHHTRYRKRYMKRQWEEIGENSVDENGESTEKKVCDSSERIKRKKMAILLGYCGVDYYGMQRNPGVRTIEEDLITALYEAKYITEDDYKNQQNAHFQRSSRTDKGVSAARQVVSLKLPLDSNIEEINKRLPDCIKVFSIKRTTNKFNSKVKCNARTYSYTLPTYIFDVNLVTDEERKTYRINKDKLDEVNNVFSLYKGTKSYHNFTEKKFFHDPSANRYMMHFGIEKVFVESDMEFAVLLVKGQSFMLHQIRKMIGLALGVIRGYTDMSTMEKAFGKDKVMIPTVPGLGLVLDMVHYDRYDAKFKGSHDSLTWEDVEDAVQKFKHEYIYPVIVKGEVEGKSMATWLHKLESHSYVPSDDAPSNPEANGDCGQNVNGEVTDELHTDESTNDDDNTQTKSDEVKVSQVTQ